MASRPFRARLRRAVSNSDGSTWHRHSRSSVSSLTSHPPPIAWRMSSWNSEMSWFALTSFGWSLCRRENARSCAVSLAPRSAARRRGRGELPDLADCPSASSISSRFPEITVSRLLKSCATPPVSCADGLHLLALVKLFLNQAARLYGVLVLGDVSEKDCEALAGGERIERVPGTLRGAKRLERNRALVRHGFAKLAENFVSAASRKASCRLRADEVAPFGNLRPGPRVEEADAPVPVDDDHAVGRTLKDHRDAGRGFLGLFLRLGQFAARGAPVHRPWC